jgi:type II secretory pathway component GspD/PulD (secretin)
MIGLGAPVLLVGLALSAGGVSGQAPTARPQESTARRISVSWQAAPILDVLRAFSVFSGKSIVAGAGVSGTVTADINDRPWDVALQAILSGRGLVAVEDESGIIRVDDMLGLNEREAIEPLLTRSYRLSFVEAEEVRAALEPLLSERGSISVSPSTNTLIVSDIERVHRSIAGVIRGGPRSAKNRVTATLAARPPRSIRPPDSGRSSCPDRVCGRPS